MTDLLILATEAGHVAPDHIAAKLAVPIGIVIFCGSVYLLLWANYGARKGALIYFTSFFAFTMMLGVFWWFGAPGTPRATGLQNFPGQEPDHYFSQWLPCEPGSERCDLYPSTAGLDAFTTPEQYLGLEGASQEELEDNLKYSLLSGDLSQANQSMGGLHLPDVLGANRRTALSEALDEALASNPDIDLDAQIDDGGESVDRFQRQDPFYTARPSQTLVTDDQGELVVATTFETYANYLDRQSFEAIQLGPLEERTYFAIRDPGAIWFPSAIWTLGSVVLFIFFLWRLDALEQDEKSQQHEADQPEDVAVPVAQ